MAFLRVEKKKSGTYLRVVESYKQQGQPKHRTLYSMGKVETYHPKQLESIAKQLLALAGVQMEDIVANAFHETGRYNYGYALVIKKLWKVFKMDVFVKKLNAKSRVRFDWMSVLQLMIAERINEPCSKRKSSFQQHEYIGISEKEAKLQHFYRTLDLLSAEQKMLKKHLYETQRNLFSQSLDVVFYDVTTLYFDSQVEHEGALRQKGYSKDGKAHKTQVVLGLLVDKLRNPISYQIYKGNTYEGKTMLDAIDTLKKQYDIDNIIVVADSAMIDKDNRKAMMDKNVDYILGDRIRNLPAAIQEVLLDKTQHKKSGKLPETAFTYTETRHQGRRIICTYSTKRARKDAAEREKLIAKAGNMIAEPAKYKQATKRGAGRFIVSDKEGTAIKLNTETIKHDAKYDGYKALSTTTNLPIEKILNKYKDLFEVEHAFRTLKSQLEIRPVYHWTDKRIEGHISMCFLAYTFLNYLRNQTGLQQTAIVKTLDKMQLSKIKQDKSEQPVYMRSSITEEQKILTNKLKVVVPNDITPQSVLNQYFT